MELTRCDRPGGDPVPDRPRALRIRLQTTHARRSARTGFCKEFEPDIRVRWHGGQLDHARKGMVGVQGPDYPFGRRTHLGYRVERRVDRLGQRPRESCLSAGRPGVAAQGDDTDVYFQGVKIYDTSTQQRIGYVDRGANAPRAELFKCSLQWKDDHTLVIGWADHIKVVRVRARSRSQSASGLPPLTVEMTAIYQVDCMVSGLAQYQNSFLVLAYISPDTYDNEATEDRAEQRRKAANPPELRLIDKGEELSADVLSLANHHMYGCNDYSLIKSQREGEDVFFVVSPSDVIVVRPRDEADHIDWLVDRQKFDEALTAAEALQKQHGSALDVKAIGLKYINHLISQGRARCPSHLPGRTMQGVTNDLQVISNKLLPLRQRSWARMRTNGRNGSTPLSSITSYQ